MIKALFAAFLLLSASRIVAQQNLTSIIPRPLNAQPGTGSFTITRRTVVIAKGTEAEQVATLFNYFFKKEHGFALPVNKNTTKGNIILKITNDAKYGKEDYQLKVTGNDVTITGQKGGVFYGVQSLLQLITEKNDALVVNAVTINDHPNFQYRGLMLDAARHFFSVEEIKKVMDVMATLKLNKFHWHLTDDQGWRLEIKKYPKLTAISAWRDSTIIGSYGDYRPFIYDGQKSGGFYTQEQAREVVKYAADRNIEVIPEIEMPGHSTAALAAYPQFGNDTGTYHVPGYWGVHYTIYNPGDGTFQFLQDVLTEVMAIFPSKYIHIGGDEVPKDEWKKSALAQNIIQQNHLKDENELQSWFINRMEKFLNKNGRNLIGWDEILEGGLSPNATVMSWRGEQGGIDAAKQGHNVIMTPGAFVYLDHAQARDNKTEPLNIGGYLPINVVYGYNPLPISLTPAEQQHIMGLQGNMWTEYVPTDAKLEYMLFPRAAALAEAGWTIPANKDYPDFTKRLPLVLTNLDKFGINYRIPDASVIMGYDAASGRRNITIIPFVSGATVYYTIDGHKADNTANAYKAPILMPFTNGRPLTLKYIIVTPGNRVSNEFSMDVR